jgi:adenine deaminase
MAGTDFYLFGSPAGSSLHTELEALVHAGLTPYQSLAATTTVPAKFLGRARTSGSIAVGKVADLLVLDANPLDDIRNTRRIQGVVVRGRWTSKGSLDSASSVLERRLAPAHRLIDDLWKNGARASALEPGAQAIGVSASALAQIVRGLVTAHRAADAVAVSALLTTRYAQSADSWVQAADARLANADTTGALAAYDHALFLDPGNVAAQSRISTLRERK